MKKNFLKTLTVLSFAVIMSICSVQNASAVFELFDGKVQVSGFIKETAFYKIAKFDREYDPGPKQGQSTRLDFLQTAAYLETLINIKEDPFGWNVRLFTGFKYWWEKAPLIDGNQHDAIPSYQRKKYITPYDFEKDILTECYLDIQKGPWQVKLGKQIVIWGQNDIGRVADVVNPLKLTHGVPGVDTWEEVKQGLWMIRAFYQSELPGNLLFEVIFNPGDHKHGDFFGYTGTHWGEPYAQDGGKGLNAGEEEGIADYMLEGARRANPSWDIDKTYSFGGRIMGQTGNFNWTLLVWNRLMDFPLANPDTIQEYAGKYVYNWTMFSGEPWSHPGFDNTSKYFKYKRFTTIGGTVMTEWPWLHYTTWDLEWFYEIGSPLGSTSNLSGVSGDADGWTRKDIFGFSLKVGDRFRMPDFMNNMLGTTKKVDWTFTYFYEKVFSHDHDLILGDRYHKQHDSVADGVSFWCKVELFNSAFAFVNISSYYLQTGGQMHVPTLVYYFPTSVLNGGLRATFGVKIYMRQSHDAVYTNYDKKDSIIMRLSYEF